MVNLASIGVILLFVAILLIMIGSSKGEAKVAVGGFIGPMPFGWANEPKMMWGIIMLTATVALFFLLMRFGALR